MSLILSILVLVSNAQVPTQQTLSQCYGTGNTNKRWCVPSDGSSLNGATLNAQGYCCADASTDANCVHGVGVVCTYNQETMPKPLWYTYWPGLTSTICGDTHLTATSEVQYRAATPVIEQRNQNSADLEGCYYYIKPDFDEFYDDAVINIKFNYGTNAEIYVFAGTDRRNFTIATEWTTVASYPTTPLGAPAQVSINDGAIVVMKMVTSNSILQTGQGEFSYWVTGRKYNWIDKPFIGDPVAQYFTTIVVIWLTGCCCFFPCIGPVLLLVAGILIAVLSIICPCIPLFGCIAISSAVYCITRGNKGGKGRRTRIKGRRANRNFGRQRTRSGVQSFSPPGGKTAGKIPKEIGRGNSPNASFRKQQSLKNNESSRSLKGKLDDFDASFASSPRRAPTGQGLQNQQSFRSQKSIGGNNTQRGNSPSPRRRR